MPEVTTTLTGHEVKTGKNARGTWTLNIFEDSDGGRFTTFDKDISSQAFRLINFPVKVTYEEKPARDPQYPPDRVIQALESLNGAAAPDNGTVAAGAPVVDKELRIMRQSALERAIYIFATAQQDPLQNLSELLELSDQLIDYFTEGREAVALVEA